MAPEKQHVTVSAQPERVAHQATSSPIVPEKQIMTRSQAKRRSADTDTSASRRRAVDESDSDFPVSKPIAPIPNPTQQQISIHQDENKGMPFARPWGANSPIKPKPQRVADNKAMADRLASSALSSRMALQDKGNVSAQSSSQPAGEQECKVQ